MAQAPAFQILIRVNRSTNEYVLGPICSDTNEADDLLAHMLPECFATPLHHDLPRPILRSTDFWPSTNLDRSVNKVIRAPYTSWFDSQFAQHSAEWERMGVRQAIEITRVNMPIQWDFVISLVHFWNPQINAFVFPSGIVGISLVDVYVLLGLPVEGDPLCVFDDPKPTSAGLRFPGSFSSYGNMVETFRFISEKSIADPLAIYGTGWPQWSDEEQSRLLTQAELTHQEHRAFLLLWVSRYLTSNQSKGPKLGLLPLVDRLLDGHRVPLAEHLLGLLYNTITNLQQSWFKEGMSPKNVSGPLWFLRLWGAFRFRNFLGLDIPAITDPSFARTLASVKFPYSLDKYIKFFMSTSTRNGPNPLWHYDYKRLPQVCFQTMANLDRQALPQGEARVWSRFLTARLLFPGGTYPQSSSDPLVNLTVAYNPHFFAVSFGLSQSLPRVLRHPKIHADNIRLVKNQTRVGMSSHSIKAFDISGTLRPNFTKWWNIKALPKLFPDPSTMISRAVRPAGRYLFFILINVYLWY